MVSNTFQSNYNRICINFTLDFSRSSCRHRQWKLFTFSLSCCRGPFSLFLQCFRLVAAIFLFTRCSFRLINIINMFFPFELAPIGVYIRVTSVDDPSEKSTRRTRNVDRKREKMKTEINIKIRKHIHGPWPINLQLVITHYVEMLRENVSVHMRAHVSIRNAWGKVNKWKNVCVVNVFKMCVGTIRV